MKITLPASYSKTFFSYYLIVRLLDSQNDTIDRRDVPILNTNFLLEFDLEDEINRKKLASYEIEIELYQYRLRIFDCLKEEASIKLKRFRSEKVLKIKHSETWDEELYLFEVNLKESQEESQDSMLKIVKILDVQNPFKLKESEKAEFERLKHSDVIIRAKEDDAIKEETKEEIKEEVKKQSKVTTISIIKF